MLATSTPSADESELLPPPNFAHVSAGVLRSSFPAKKHFAFLETLRLKTVLFLCPEDYPDASVEWLDAHGVTLAQVGVGGNKALFAEIPAEDLQRAAHGRRRCWGGAVHESIHERRHVAAPAVGDCERADGR